MDIVLSSGVADNPPWAFYGLNGGVWITEDGLNVGWKADVAGPSDQLWLYVATYDPRTGSLKGTQRYNVFPPGVTLRLGDVQGMSGSNTDAFAACLRSWDMRNQPRNQTLFIGHLHDADAHQQIDLGWKSGAYDVTDIGWDGDAFTVHARDNANGDILVTRVDPAGQVILPLTKYGTTPSSGGTPLGYRMSTSSDSGMSYLFDAPGAGRYLSGHDRSGAPLPWAAAMPLNLVIPGLAMADSAAFRPGVGADAAGGLWAAWVTYNSGGGFVRAAAHVTVGGDVDRSFMVPVSSGQKAAAVGVESATKVWIADSDSVDILLAEFDRDDLAPVRPLVVGPFALNSGQVWQPDFLTAVGWRGERWLAFTEQSVLLHIVKVLDGCTYLSAFRPATN